MVLHIFLAASGALALFGSVSRDRVSAATTALSFLIQMLIEMAFQLNPHRRVYSKSNRSILESLGEINTKARDAVIGCMYVFAFTYRVVCVCLSIRGNYFKRGLTWYVNS